MPTTSPNMGLIVPVASTGVTGTGDPGPGYAQNISTDLLSTIDAHNHAPGNGVQITPAGMNISADLTFNSNNATSLRAARFTNQASGLNGVADVGELYVLSGNLWYVTSSAVQVQITNGGGLATGITGGPGAQGAVGTFTGSIFTPTAIWQPTGQYSGTYNVSSWLATGTIGTGIGYTCVPMSYPIKPSRSTVVSILANIVGYDGANGVVDCDVKGTFLGVSGAVGSGLATGVGTFTYCYEQTNPVGSGWPYWTVGSGWGVVLVPTGNQISVMLSAPTGGPSGTYINYVVSAQITERGNP